jgi:hypothetical protein
MRARTALAHCAALAAPARARSACPPDSVPVGDVCVDGYEAAVWQIPEPAGRTRKLVRKVQQGKATVDEPVSAFAAPVGCTVPPYSDAPIPPNFPADGNWTPLPGSSPPTPGLYAASLPGEVPASCTSQLQAKQACALSGKHLTRNDERAATGTADPGVADDGATTCATNSPSVVPAGSRSACVSAWGVYDMVGNLYPYTADWDELGSECFNTTAGDRSFIGDPTVGAGLRFVMKRGGVTLDGDEAGVFAIDTDVAPNDPALGRGLRCARALR